MTGGTLVGYTSQAIGRRLSIIIICIVGGALLYPYTFTSSNAVIAAAFFEQFCVQGAWGVVSRIKTIICKYFANHVCRSRYT